MIPGTENIAHADSFSVITHLILSAPDDPSCKKSFENPRESGSGGVWRRQKATKTAKLAFLADKAPAKGGDQPKEMTAKQLIFSLDSAIAEHLGRTIQEGEHCRRYHRGSPHSGYLGSLGPVAVDAEWSIIWQTRRTFTCSVFAFAPRT